MREGSFGPSLFSLAKTNSPYTTSPPVPTSIPSTRIEAEDAVDIPYQTYHRITVCFDDVDWQSPRQTAGSAALQWQALVATRLMVGPPAPDADDAEDADRRDLDPLLSPGSSSSSTATSAVDNGDPDHKDCRTIISFRIGRAEAFALIREDRWANVMAGTIQPQWYLGDVYGYQLIHESLGSDICPDVSHVLPVPQGKYILAVRPSFEARIFELPPIDTPPTVHLSVAIDWENQCIARGRPATHVDVIDRSPSSAVPSVVMGKLASQHIAFAFQNKDPTAAVKIVKIRENADEPIFANIGYSQTVIPPCSTQKITFEVSGAHSLIRPETRSISFWIVSSAEGRIRISATLLSVDLNHVDFRGDNPDSSYVYTYLSAGGAQSAVIQPPRELGDDGALNILALHGAGVEATSDFWRTALPRQQRGWILMPTGLTSWGLDWTMASKQAYEDLLKSEYYAPLTTRAPGNRLFVIGHSNGGQGALYALTHDPDRFAGGFIASGYVNMQEYVSNNWQASRNVLDPVLQGILQSSLSVFHNDLFASHLVGKPITIKYGSCDNNVPRWNSRLLASLISQWSLKTGEASEYPRLIEVPDKGHWWDGVLSSEDVCKTIRDADEATARPPPPVMVKHFVVNAVVPSETGPLHGVQILETAIPGRLARIEVRIGDNSAVNMRTVNVARMTIAGGLRYFPKLFIDGVPCTGQADRGDLVHIARRGQEWIYTNVLNRPRLLCPISLFLSAPSRIFVILPKHNKGNLRRKAYESVAKRWALDVLLYLTVNVYVVEEDDLNESMCGPRDYHVFMGGPRENASSRTVGGICVAQGSITIRGRTFSEPGTALLYSVPHLRHPHVGKALVLTGTDEEGIERAGRLLPVRTGVPVPEWIVVGKDADRFGAGGVVAAGWYDNAWGWSPEMSYV